MNEVFHWIEHITPSNNYVVVLDMLLQWTLDYMATQFSGFRNAQVQS